MCFQFSESIEIVEGTITHKFLGVFWRTFRSSYGDLKKCNSFTAKAQHKHTKNQEVFSVKQSKSKEIKGSLILLCKLPLHYASRNDSS